MTRPTDLTGVLDSGMCTGCGACVAACPSLKLRLHPEKQMYEPDGVGDERAATVCPGVGVDFSWLHGLLFPEQKISSLGAVEAVYLAQSVDRERNLRASSGGVIKELMQALLGQPDVDGVIALQHRSGLVYEPDLVTKPESIDELPGSIYHSVDFSGALRLLREREGRFVLAAIPCQLEGLYQYILRYEPHLCDRIHTTIGLICGWTYTHHSLAAICRFSHVDFGRLSDVAYRGGGPVGSLRLVTPEGETRVNRRVHFRYQVAFDRSFNLPRCHLCVNHTNYLADIVVGDAWLPSTVRTKTGISLVLCRRPETRALVERLAAEGRLRTLEVSTEEIIESQTRRVVFGDFAYAYAKFRKEAGLFTPEMEGPNRANASLCPPSEVSRFHEATTRKVALQRARRYGELWIRKASVEAGPLAYRYLRWFAVRVLRVKSLLGRRQEVPSEDMARFV